MWILCRQKKNFLNMISSYKYRCEPSNQRKRKKDNTFVKTFKMPRCLVGGDRPGRNLDRYDGSV